MQEYTHTAHILSREYHFSVSDPKAITEEGAQILHKASVDYYRRSFSQDSVDATESTPPVSDSESRARSLLSRLIQNAVTPVCLLEIVDDIMTQESGQAS